MNDDGYLLDNAQPEAGSRFEALSAAGLVTDEDIDRHLANVASGRLDLATSPMISAWGRRQ